MRSALAVLPIALALLASSPAFAQSNAARAEALKRYNEGIALHDAGKEQDAYVKFAQAYAVLKTPPILFNLARTEQLTLRFVEAAAHFREYVALPEQALIPKATRDKARAFLAELNAQLGHVALTAPAGASIVIDGRELAQRAPFTEDIDMMPGTRVIVARLGDNTASASVEVSAGSTTRVNLQFDARPAPAPTPAPAAPPTAPAAAPTAAPERPAVVEESHATRDVLRWTSTGVAVVGISVGVGFMLAANSKDSDLSAYQVAHPRSCAGATGSACAEATSLQDDRDRSRTLSTVGFVVGGIGAAAAVATWFFWPNRGGAASGRGTWVAPSVGVAGYGLQAGGRF